MFSVLKQWGVEYFMEVNPEYTVKKIIIKNGEQLPRHYHERKRETFHIVKGAGTLFLDEAVRLVGPGDIATIEPGVRHTLIPSGGESVEIMESSTTFLTDSIREEIK